MKPLLFNATLAVALAAVLALVTAGAADVTPAETKTIAEEAFIYGFPMVMNYGTLYEYFVRQIGRPVQVPVQPGLQHRARVAWDHESLTNQTEWRFHSAQSLTRGGP
jgi:hypothetical protein